MKGELNRTVMVYVDSVEDRIPRGRFHLASEQEALPFHGFCQLLINTNQQLDREKFPQSFTELRKFQKPTKTEACAAAAMNQNCGKIASFSIRILFRQNASWQGSVTWLEGKQTEYFRSVLELMVLLDNALGYTEER